MLDIRQSQQLPLTQSSKKLNPLYWRVREWQIFIKNLCLIFIAKSLLLSIILLWKNIIDIQLLLTSNVFVFRNVYKLHIIIAGIHNAFSLPFLSIIFQHPRILLHNPLLQPAAVLCNEIFEGQLHTRWKIQITVPNNV